MKPNQNAFYIAAISIGFAAITTIMFSGQESISNPKDMAYAKLIYAVIAISFVFILLTLAHNKKKTNKLQCKGPRRCRKKK